MSQEQAQREYFVYIIPLGRVYWGRRTNRADRAVKLIRKFVARHTKADKVVILNEVNEYVWRRGREKPPRRIKVLVTVKEEEEEGEEGSVKVRKAVVRLAGDDLKPGRYQELPGKEKAGKAAKES